MADTQGINDSAAEEPATPQSIIERPVDGQLGGAPKPSEDAWMEKEDDQDDQAYIARKSQDESLNA